MSQTIAHPNPKQKQTKIKFGPRIPNPNAKAAHSRKGRTSSALALRV